MTTLVTCASGFVSQAFVRALNDNDVPVHVLIRDPQKTTIFDREKVYVGDIFNKQDVARSVGGVDTVVHVPPRVYPSGSEEHQLEMHRQAHVGSTRTVLEKAIAQGVERFLLVSSAHATGRGSNHALCEERPERPPTPYAQAKLESEEVALDFAAQGLIDVVIVRPPNIYGSGDGGFITWMRRMAMKNIWLPLKSLNVYHSLVFVDNLARGAIALLDVSKKEREASVFIVKDDHDYRPAELYAAVCGTLGKPAMMFPFPPPALKTLGAMGSIFDGLPKVRGLKIFRQFVTPQKYCSHRFQSVMPGFPMMGIEAAVAAALSPAGSVREGGQEMGDHGRKYHTQSGTQW